MVTAYVLMDLNNAIANTEENFPWLIKKHHQHIKYKLNRHYTVCGRKTFEQWKYHSSRWKNIVVTGNKDYHKRHIQIYINFDNMMHALSELDYNINLLGGESIFKQGFDYCDRLYISQVQDVMDNPKRFFPEINPNEWDLVSEKDHKADYWNVVPHKTLIFQRKEV